ncbi:conserved hypothetical protein [Ricinus communis]|uniref:Uncharacterized protein n=1 Tax=Ricinus communis TaxID=3988 RepID=B9SEN2_RICCO|nr:conserved hypothetical protein [Ricinus communis]
MLFRLLMSWNCTLPETDDSRVWIEFAVTHCEDGPVEGPTESTKKLQIRK